MTVFPDLHNLPRQLRHPEVRDLAWVMLAPPMLAHLGMAQLAGQAVQVGEDGHGPSIAFYARSGG